MKIFVVASVMSALLALQCQATLACQLGSTWSSVDAMTAEHSAATAVGATAQAIFVVGTASILPTGDRTWQVRRSQDRGATWSSVDAFNPGGVSRAEAIAVDRASGVVFVGGNVSRPPSPLHWVVRRSEDGGTSWLTLPEPSPLEPADQLTGLAIAGGRLLVVTSSYGELAEHAPRGRVWGFDETTRAWAAEHVSPIAYTSIVGVADGRAYAAATAVDPLGNPTSCATAERGARGEWAESVDTRSAVTSCLNVAVARRESDGAVVAVGSADRGELARRWRVSRLAGQVPAGRELIEEYPASAGPAETAAATAATFTLDGRLVVAGGFNLASSLVTRISDVALTAMAPSDLLAGVPISISGITQASGAATSPRGDVYVVGSWVSDRGQRWVTRQLRCD